MKKRCIAYFDKQLECTATPLFAVETIDEIKEGLFRSIVKADPDNLNNFKGKNLVLLGEYDDTKGFTDAYRMEVLADCDEIIQKVYGKYEEQASSN